MNGTTWLRRTAIAVTAVAACATLTACVPSADDTSSCVDAAVKAADARGGLSWLTDGNSDSLPPLKECDNLTVIQSNEAMSALVQHYLIVAAS